MSCRGGDAYAWRRWPPALLRATFGVISDPSVRAGRIPVPSDVEWAAMEAHLAERDALAITVAEPPGDENFGRCANGYGRGHSLNHRGWLHEDFLTAQGWAIFAPEAAKRRTGGPLGRPKTDLTPKLRAAISQSLGPFEYPPPAEKLDSLVTAGVPVVVLAEYFGRDRRTLQRWMSQ